MLLSETPVSYYSVPIAEASGRRPVFAQVGCILGLCATFAVVALATVNFIAEDAPSDSVSFLGSMGLRTVAHFPTISDVKPSTKNLGVFNAPRVPPVVLKARTAVPRRSKSMSTGPAPLKSLSREDLTDLKDLADPESSAPMESFMAPKPSTNWTLFAPILLVVAGLINAVKGAHDSNTQDRQRIAAAAIAEVPEAVDPNAPRGIVNEAEAVALPFTMAELKDAIPEDCFEKDLGKSLFYMAFDFAVVGLMYYNQSWFFGLGILGKLLWWNVVGFYGWCLFVVGHDCGHGSFSKYGWLNQLCGHICHAPLLVPFNAWRISHRHHHQYHNDVDRDHSWRPSPAHKVDKLNPIIQVLRFSPLILFVYPLYLLSNSQENGFSGCHFWPWNPLFKSEERFGVGVSSLSVIAFLGGIVALTTQIGFWNMFQSFWIPYWIFVAWLDLVTLMQHTDENALFFRGDAWTYLRGAMSTIDRTYKHLIDPLNIGYGRIIDHLHHNISDGHVVHHIFFTQIPHYKLIKATRAIEPLLGKHYRFDPTPIPIAFWKTLKNCWFVDDVKHGVVAYKGGEEYKEWKQNENAIDRQAMMGMVSVSKYQGLGNDFILVDNRDTTELKVTSEEAVGLCDRNFGIGGDGVIFALPKEASAHAGDGVVDCDYTMRIFNSDGSEPEMCGNGIRCLARFVADVDGVPVGTQRVHTLAGVLIPDLKEDGDVCVDMGEPVLNGPDVPTTLTPNGDKDNVLAVPLEVAGQSWTVSAVSMGNPHACIYQVDGMDIADVDELDLPAIGPLFEANAVFPAKTNTEFVQVINRSHVKMRVWERGAAETLACGTGACALVVAGVLEGRLDRKCRVDLPGGPLNIEWREDNNKIYMTGPAKPVFSAEVDTDKIQYRKA